MSATAFTSVEQREVVKCDNCNLVQYVTSNSLCRKCHKLLPVVEEVKPPAAVAPTIALPAVLPFVLELVPQPRPSIGVAAGFRKAFLRRRSSLGLRQRQLGSPRFLRADISNPEHGSLPSFSHFQRYARALNTRGSSLLEMIDDPRAEALEPLACSDKTILRHTGPVLRRLREGSGKDRKEFRLAIGVTSTLLSQWETGRKYPKLIALERVASMVGKPLHALVAEIENAACLGG